MKFLFCTITSRDSDYFILFNFIIYLILIILFYIIILILFIYLMQ